MEPAAPLPNPTAIRAILAALGVTQASVGLTALLAPRAFYEDFPFGRGWVEVLPAYSEHLVRDVGGLFLATAVVLFAAARIATRTLAAVASWSLLAFTVPHTVFHLFNLGPYDTLDAVGNVVTLTGTVIGPIVILLLLRRNRAAPGG